ncbi:MAG: hypothetical protein M1832_001213 [Thelocarpon impressellum]|nr:MAG: hypothetical protein M1832_001213 [Thelocarpon impressellum]
MASCGGYQGYQGSALRHQGLSPAGAHVLDPRLALVDRLLPRLFRGARALDVGCNAGAVAVQLASSLGAASVTGADVDAALIARAEGHLSFGASRTRPAAVGRAPSARDYFPVSSVLDHGHRRPPPEQAAAEPAFPRNVRFVCEDWVATPAAPRAYTLVLALSVVKWIHLAHLDAGLRRFFRKCAASLGPGGHLVLEVQPWASYEKAVAPKKAPHLAGNLARLQIRPDAFTGMLSGEGFAHVAESEELPRKICVYRKL